MRYTGRRTTKDQWKERAADIELARRLTEPLPALSHAETFCGPLLVDRGEPERPEGAWPVPDDHVAAVGILGLQALLDRFPRQLSGGQQQLVGVARAVISNPKLILADEPTGNLHSSQGEEIMELFKKLNGDGTTIIQVTHSEKNATYGNRIIQLRDGFVV
jgi:predicted ABC-type transport system involved in lysophospholipase L1 biosynthesis ATPase subunit